MRRFKEELPEAMVICAFRYCLGRATYVVGECCDYLACVWHRLSPHTQHLILNEITEALQRDRAGMEQDRQAWTLFRNQYQQEVTQ
jgi:hypothetical protein